jgi:uncharacterized membrane protein YuzA (DUF378 family)
MVGLKKCNVSSLSSILILIGGLNWGLIGLGYFLQSDWNLVDIILGGWPMIENTVYILVGLAAVVSLFGCRCKTCHPAK